MKRKLWIPIVVVVVLLAVCFAPIPQEGFYSDGGTRVYIALTYKIVDWNRYYGIHTYRAIYDGLYDKTCIYFGSNRNKSVEELWKLEYENIYKSLERQLVATVLEINEISALVQPVEGETELLSSDKISFRLQGMEGIGAEVGSVVEITYTGGIAESYPAQINATGWRLLENLRDTKYSEQWLDKDTVRRSTGDQTEQIVITQIYSNCFFAKLFLPAYYEIKLNGTLPDGWEVGDVAECTFENVYYDTANSRMEADLLAVKESDNPYTAENPFTVYPYWMDKPVIYLYPEEETEVSVKLTLDGRLTCTYPLYNDGWTVKASPDGTLADANGKIYNYLYWEGETDVRFDLSNGFCVKGEDTAGFLETALEKLGLTRREANEFIVYWLPLMERNPYNLISFQTDRYTNAVQLEIDPAPDTVIRVFMAWQAVDSFVNLPEQKLSAPERRGFTVVEWGGAELK